MLSLLEMDGKLHFAYLHKWSFHKSAHTALKIQLFKLLLLEDDSLKNTSFKAKHCRTSLTKSHSWDFAKEGYNVAIQTQGKQFTKLQVKPVNSKETLPCQNAEVGYYAGIRPAQPAALLVGNHRTPHDWVSLNPS